MAYEFSYFFDVESLYNYGAERGPQLAVLQRRRHYRRRPRDAAAVQHVALHFIHNCAWRVRCDAMRRLG